MPIIFYCSQRAMRKVIYSLHFFTNFKLNVQKIMLWQEVKKPLKWFLFGLFFYSPRFKPWAIFLNRFLINGYNHFFVRYIPDTNLDKCVLAEDQIIHFPITK